jgi:predicted secreted protein
MRRLLALLALLAAPPALAQPTPLSETALHLGESAEVTRAPDEVIAILRTEARASTAAAAQAAVNGAMSAALARAARHGGVTASTGGYWTGRVDEGRSWQAAQQITLRSGDGPAMLDLTGALQSSGLALVALNWSLTREATRTAREEASRLALDALRRRADAIAAQLGLQVVGLREVRIDAPDRGPRPAPMAMAAARAGGAPAAPPVAVAEDVIVGATVEAVVVLRPR